jgi:putative heme-binding domain-containing protein
VVNTGPWYKICCPTSQLAKPDLLGGVYRIRRKGAPRIEDPRGLKLAWTGMRAADLAALLDDPRPAVRSRAIHQLSKQGGEAVAVLAGLLKNSGSVEARRSAVWALTGLEGTPARESVRMALGDKDESIRHAATHSVSVWRDSGAFPQLLDLLKKSSPPLQRAVAEALGRLGNRDAVPELLAQSANNNDRILEHSLTYALIEIADTVGTASGLRAASSNTRRAALIALDQMDGGGLKPEMVTPLLASSDPVLKQTASWIVSHHAEWGPALAGFLRRRLSDSGLSASDREELRRQLTGFSRGRAIQELLAETVSHSGSKQAQLTALEAMGKAPLKEMPDIWCKALAGVMTKPDVDMIRAAVSTTRALPIPKEGAAALKTTLLRVGRNSVLPAEVRLEAMASVSEGVGKVEPGLFEFLVGHVDPSQPVAVRSAAAHVLAKAGLTLDQLLVLTDTLKTVGPLELPGLLSAYENASDEGVGLKLIAALKQSKALSSLRPDLLKSSLGKFPASVQKQGEALLASLDIDPAKQRAHIDQLLASLKGGDVRRGQATFNSTKAACSSCHTIGYLGGKVGPDLTKIGQVRTERDLMESVIYPSASFVRSYEPVVVATKSGDIHNGLVLQDGSDEILLATGPRSEVRIARADIREMRPSAVSVMPSGLEDQLTRQELADLLAFLRQTKWGAQ